MGIDVNTTAGSDPTPTEKTVEPVKHFDSPAAVVHDRALSETEKAAALDSWEHDAQRLQTADDEGLVGGEPTRIIDVVEAKEKIGAETLTTQHK